MPPAAKPALTNKKKRKKTGDPPVEAEVATPVSETDEEPRPPIFETPAVQRKKLVGIWISKPALFVMTDDTIFVASSIRKPKDGPWQLVAKSVASEPATKTFTLNDDDVNLTTQGVKQIIAACIGGSFPGDGHSALVTQAVHTPDGAQVEFRVVLRSGEEPVGDPVRISVSDFSEKYIRRGTIAIDPDEQDAAFNFEPFPRLTEVLRVGGAFEDAEVSTMPRAAAAQVMLAMQNDEGNASKTLGGAACDLEALAADLELAYSKERSSPTISKLRGVVSTGVVLGLALHARGKLIRQLVLTTPAGESPGAPAKKAKVGFFPIAPAAPSKQSSTGSKRKAAPVSLEEDLESDDGSDSDNSSEDELTNAEIAKAKALSLEGPDLTKAKAKTQSKYKIARKSIEETNMDDSDVGFVAPEGLMSATPPGMSLIDAARIIFSEPAIRRVAACEEVPADVSVQDTPKIAKRCSLMYRRLVDAAGVAWRPADGKPPRDASVLMDWAEYLLDQVARGPSKKPNTNFGQPSGEHSSSSYTPFSLDTQQSSTNKPAEGLTGSKQAAAVSPAVALRLYEGTVHYESVRAPIVAKKPNATCGEVMNAIGDEPSHLRADLSRAMCSNGLVDAAGITTNEGRSFPPYAHAMRRQMLREVEGAIADVADADTTGEISIDADDVASLAAKVAEASDTLEDFDKAARKALGHGAAKTDTYQGVADAWAWNAPALRAMLTANAAPQREFAAISHISAVINAPPGLSRLAPTELKDWVEKVKREVKSMTRTFRMHEGPPPSWHTALEIRNSNFQYKALKGALSKPAEQGSSSGADSSQKKQKGGGKEKAKPAAGGGKGKGGGGDKPRAAQDKNAASAQVSMSAWKERTASLSDAKFKEIKDAAAKEFADVCTFYLVAKCSRGKECRRSHDRPAGFEDFLSKHGLKINGEVSSRDRARAARQHVRSSG